MTSANVHGVNDGAAGAPREMRAAARARRIAEWALLALIAFLLAKTAIAFFMPLPLPKGDRLAAVSASSAGDERQVTARNPFPASDATAAPAIDQSADLAETGLDLGLNGVWPAEDKPSAIIRLPNGEQHRFAIGEEVVRGVRLVAVFSDHVIIEQNGVREALRFENKAPFERPAPAAPQPASGEPAVRPTDQGTAPDKIENFPTRDLLNGFVRFGLGVGPDGGPAVMIFAGQDRKAFEQAGFRDGDIVRSINGTAPSPDPARMSELLGEVSRAGSASITVERDGGRKTIAFSFNQSGNE